MGRVSHLNSPQRERNSPKIMYHIATIDDGDGDDDGDDDNREGMGRKKASHQKKRPKQSRPTTHPQA